MHLRRQQRAAAMQAGPHRPNRTLERDRGIGVTQFLEITEHYDFPVADRQRQDCATEPFDLLCIRYLTHRIGVDHCRAGERLRALRERQRSAIAIQSSPGVIARDSAQPRGYRRPAGLEPGRVVHDRKKDILRDVLGCRRRTGHEHRNAVDVRVAATKQQAQGRSISGAYPGYQLIVGCVVEQGFVAHALIDSTCT